MRQEQVADRSSPAAALKRAVDAAGGQSAFGRLIKRRQSTISDWLKLAKPLPAEHVLEVEAGTGISRHDLRPDIYPREQHASDIAIDASRAAHA